MSKQVQLPRAWYPQQYNNKASRFNKPSVSTSSFSSQSLSPKTAKIIIGVLGAVAGASILGVILTAVLVTQLNKPSSTVQSGNDTTQVSPGTTVDQGTATKAPTTAAFTTAVALTTARPPVVLPVAPDPDPLNPPVQQVAALNGQIKLDQNFTDDLLDPNSDAYKKLKEEVCNEIKNSVPADLVDSVNCDNITFGPGSIIVSIGLQFKIKLTVTVSTSSFSNIVQTQIMQGFLNNPRLKANKDGFKFENPKLCNPNPCKNSGKCLDAGEGLYKCQCKPGKYGKNCDVVPTYCTCSGDPHCRTFDQLAMDYQGTCKFLLSQAKDKSFSVYLRSINRNAVTKVAWARYIELQFQSYIIRIGKLDPLNLEKKTQVMINGVIVSVPIKKDDFQIYQNGQTIECSTKIGVIISYGRWQAKVGLPPSYKKKVTGFCGDFDGNRKNDATTASGEFVGSRTNFGNLIGNSYVENTDKEKQPFSTSCSFPDVVPAPTCPGVDLQMALNLCKQLKNPAGKFKSCIKAFNLDDLVDIANWCDVDVKFTCDASVAATAVANFVDNCMLVETTVITEIIDWRVEFNISATEGEDIDPNDVTVPIGKTCSGGLIFAANASGCVNTCDQPNADASCDLPDQMNVCVCPPGTVLFKNKCVSVGDCGCVEDSGADHNVNDVWLSRDCSKQLTCQKGGKISSSLFSCPTGKSCFNSLCSACQPVNPCQNGGRCQEIPTAPGYKCTCPAGFTGLKCDYSSAVCTCYGDPHCKTFDGLRMDYQGTRKHLLVGWKGIDSGFNVYGRNIRSVANPKVALVKYVEVVFDGWRVRMERAFQHSNAPVDVMVYDLDAFIQGQKVATPYTRASVTIKRVGEFMELSTPSGLVVQYSSNWQFRIKLSSSFYKSGIRGLCGNYDGDTMNDKQLSTGGMATFTTPATYGPQIGDSWIVDDNEDTQKVPTPVDATPPADCPAATLVSVKAICALITSTTGPFAKCIAGLDADELAQMRIWCEFDAQMTCDLGGAVHSLSVLAAQCLRSNQLVVWRPVAKIPCSCVDPEMTCSPLAPPCVPTCQDPLAAETCTLPQVQDLCVCPPGKVLFMDKCVDVTSCGCIDALGLPKKLGDSWMSENCTKMLTCNKGGVISSTPTACPVGTTCHRDIVKLLYSCKKEGGTCDVLNPCSHGQGDCMDTPKGPICRCFPGYTGQNCSVGYSTCSCHGDIHCSTFDGLKLDYQGTCKFKLAQSTDTPPTFTVYARNVVRNNKAKVAWIKYVEIIYKNDIIRIGRRDDLKKVYVTVNGATVACTGASFTNYKISKSGSLYVFKTTDENLKVVFSEKWMVEVHVAPPFRGSMTGFCGNNNRIRMDDNTIGGSSSVLPSYDLKQSGKTIGDSYVVPDSENTVALSDCPSPTITPPPACPYSTIPQARALCAQISKATGVFAACQPASVTTPATNGGNGTVVPPPPTNQNSDNSTLDLQTFSDWCNFDFDQMCDVEVVHNALAVFSQKCVEYALVSKNLTITVLETINKTVVIQIAGGNVTVTTPVTTYITYYTDVTILIETALNFRNALNLPPKKCDDPNAVYAAVSTGCPATCSDPMAPTACALPDVYDSCVCPYGLVLFNDLCVSPFDCGCIGSDNAAYAIGQWWLTNSCTQKMTCVRAENGTVGTSTTPYSCPTGKLCTANKCSACQPTNPCKNGGTCQETTDASTLATPFVCKCAPGFFGTTCEKTLSFKTCYYFGNAHVMTFDSLFLDYAGRCKFALVLTDASAPLQFSVYARSTRKNGVSMVSYVEVQTPKFNVKLNVLAGGIVQALLADSPVELPFTNSSDFQAIYSGQDVILKVTDDVIIMLTQIGVSVKLGASYNSKTRGVCGNNNGQIADDLLLADGSTRALNLLNGVTENSDAKAFGDSFVNATDAPDPSICLQPSPPPPSQPPTCSFDTIKAMGKCTEIANNQSVTFKACQSSFTPVELATFSFLCTYDLTMTCRAALADVALMALSMMCVDRANVKPPSVCDGLGVDCTCRQPNTILAPSASACPLTCLNPDPTAVALTCTLPDLTNLCVCKQGYVLFRGACVPLGSCGCFDKKGMAHNVGESWLSDDCRTSYTCHSSNQIVEAPTSCPANKTCVKGKCTACLNANQCKDGVCLDTDSGMGYFCRCNPGFSGNGYQCTKKTTGLCQCYGDPHCRTFDKQKLDYQGLSKFILVKSLSANASFTIFLKNMRLGRNTKVAWIKYVEILTNGNSVRLQRAYESQSSPIVAMFNGSPLSVPFRSPTGEYSVAYEGSSVRYTSAFGFTVWFLTNYRVNVEVTSDLRSQLTGLCGNFDGNARNDLQVNGLDVSSLPDPGNAVGNSFIVQENQTSSTTFFESWFSTSPSAPTTSPPSPTPTMLSPDIQTPDTCPAGNAKFRLSCSQFGDLSGLFSTCLKLMEAVEVSAFVESCQFDVDYTCEGADVVKQAYLTLTLDCYSRFGVTIQHDVEPDCNCVEPNTVCMATAPGCPATCDNPTHPSTCIQPDAKYVCACQPGFLLFNGRCVPPTDCGCVYTDGRFFKKGDSWISQDCKLKLTCSAPNIYTSDVFSCPAGRACVSGACLACTSNPCGTNGVCIETSTTRGYVCKCKPGFMGDTCNFSLSKATYSRTHCTTFDKATFDFKGIGNFLFAKSTLKAVPGLPKLINYMEFEVRVVNVYLVNTKEIAYAKILIINFLSHRIVIDRDIEGLDARITVTVDGNIVNLPYNSTDFEIVWNSLSSVDFSSNLGSFVVTYGASDSTITVTIPSSYLSGGKGLAPPNGLTGVCGGFDGIPDNDLVTADNKSVASSPDPGFEIGLSYTDKSDPYFKNLTSLPNEVLSKECSNATLLDKCNLIQSALFRPFLVTLGVGEAQTFVKNCIADVTRLCNLDAFCTAAERVAKLAEAMGFVTKWRDILGCPLQCPPGQIFSPRSTGCPATCVDPDAPATCTEPDLIGECVCPPGQVLFKNKCVNRTSCGCADVATGRFYEIGQSWRSLGCAKKLTCTVGGNVTQVMAGNCSKGICVGNRCSGCTPNPCLNGGQCIETSEEGDFICKCPPGVFGRRCGGSNSQADIVIMIEDGPADCNPAENNFNSCVFSFYRKILNFLSSFVANLPLGGGDIRIAGVSFSSQPQLLWSFDDYTRVADLQTAISQVTLGNANQPINLAISIDFIISQVFQISNTMSTAIRTPTLTLTPPAPKILLIFTDAQPRADASKIGMVVSKLAASGVQVYTFGLTSRVDVKLLGQISSSPKQKYANFFPSFMDISVDVLKQILKIVDLNVPSPFNGKNPFDPNGPLPKFPQLTAKCKCTGDTHCKTFDGLNLDYQGTCKTLLSSNNLPGNTSLDGPNITAPPFSVYIHNYHREPNSKVAWVRNVEVVLGAKVIRFIKIGESYSAIASVTVDGVSVEPPHVNNDFTIIHNADGLELRTTDGSLVVGYNVNGMASVDIPNYLTKKVNGICGNFDGNQGNDMVTKDGQDVSGMRDPGKFVGDSYIVMGDVDNAGIMDSCKPPDVTNQTCSPSMKELTMKCNLLTDVNELFGECINKVGRKVAQIFQYDCLFDLQQTCDENVVEPAIFQFVLYCFQHAQVDIPDWRRKLKFPCRCPDDKICIPKGPPCQPNFFFPDKPSVCALPDAIDVCTCPPRKVLFNGVCVDLQQAGCIDAEGRARKTGEIWLSKDCTQLLTCVGLNDIKSEATSCPDQTSCFNGKCSACVAAQPCLNGGSCLETLACQDKSPTNPGCYWKKFNNKKSLASTSSGLSAVSQLADCFQACYQTSRTDCMGINWNPSANMGQRCGLVVKAGGDLVDDVSFTYYEWTCSNQPCAAANPPVPPPTATTPPTTTLAAVATPAQLFSCVCKKGFTGNTCDQASGTCMLSEGPQITTFDGFSLLYRAPCMIILASFNVPTLPTFSVASKNVPAWKQGAAAVTTWTREIIIQWNGRLIKFKSDGLGIPKCDVFDMLTNVKLPYTAPFSVDDISVQVVGADLEFSTSSQIKVGLAKSGRSYIIMPPTYSGKVMGTCGNFDGVKENDGIPFSDSLAGSAQSGFTGIGGGGNSTDVGNSVGNSFYVSDSQYPYLSNCSVPDLSNTSLTPVPPTPLDKSRCDAIVSANSSFAACVALLDPAMVAVFVNTCKFNVDFFLNDLLSCTALESFVDLCKLSAGVSTPPGWRKTFNCKCQCAPGFVCSPSSPACPATCNNPDAPKTCLEPELQDVCVCPAGKLLFNGTCVLPSMCGCVDGSGTARKTLEKWLNPDCSMEYTCARNGTTSSVPFTCPAGTLCTAGVCSACASNNPCQNNGTCIDVMNSPNPICKCLTGFAGKFCEYSGSNNTCTISGNGHLLTFDGASLDFGGDCKFLLLQSLPPAPLFKVFGKNFVLNKNAAFLRYVEIETAIGVLRLERPELSLSTMGSVDVSMNGSLVHLPLKGDQWEVAYRGQKVEWRTDFGVSILYHNWQAIIKLPSQFAGSLIGLCGNFDGSKDNDMMQLNGRPPVSTTKPGQEIANSFIVNDLEAIDPNSCLDLVNNPVPVDDPVAPSATVLPATGTLPTVTATVGLSSLVTAVSSVTGSPLSFTVTRPVGDLTTAPNLTQPPTPPAGCQLSAFEISKYTLLCTQVIDVHAAFAACANVLGSNLFIQAQTKCQLDVVLTCSADMFTLAFSNLVALCQEVGVVVTVNSTANFTFPPPSCPVSGMVLNPAPSPPCLATCADLDAPKHCTFPDEVNVCSCPPGFVFSSKRCIPRNQCGCVSKTGLSYNVGSVWFESGCTKKYTCLGPSEIKEEENKSGTC